MLENNAPTMATTVTSYLVEEITELIYDNDKLEKWNTHVRELGLKGQEKLSKPEKSPIPFMHMKKSLVSVFECLCPRKVDVEVFSITPIPVEILDLIALSRKENYFDKVQIWYDDKSPDPVCVGLNYGRYFSRNTVGSLETLFPTKEAAQESMNKLGVPEQHVPHGIDEEYYLIGKWGDVNYSFEELKKKATIRYITEESIKHHKEIKEAQRKIDDIRITAAQKFEDNVNNEIELPFL